MSDCFCTTKRPPHYPPPYQDWALANAPLFVGGFLIVFLVLGLLSYCLCLIPVNERYPKDPNNPVKLPAHKVSITDVTNVYGHVGINIDNVGMW